MYVNINTHAGITITQKSNWIKIVHGALELVVKPYVLLNQNQKIKELLVNLVPRYHLLQLLSNVHPVSKSSVPAVKKR